MTRLDYYFSPHLIEFIAPAYFTSVYPPLNTIFLYLFPFKQLAG